MSDITKEEREEVDRLNQQITMRKLKIEATEWKHAFESLVLYVRNNMCELSLFEFLNKVVELRPRKEK